MIRTILINGKKVRCRALKVGELRRIGKDIFCENGTGKSSTTGKYGPIPPQMKNDYYRPLPLKKHPAPGRGKVKPFQYNLKSVGRTLETLIHWSQLTLGQKAAKELLEMLLTPSPKARKAK